MAVTALKTGCKLPIRVQGTKSQIVRFVPPELASLSMQRHVYAPEPYARLVSEVEVQIVEEKEPQVYDIY
jgi:hypothetical protein